MKKKNVKKANMFNKYEVYSELKKKRFIKKKVIS